MVPDQNLTIRERAVAAWPSAWQGQNLRDILVTLGYDVDTPWRKMSRKDRNWILFTEDQPTVPVYAGFTPAETKQALKRKLEPSYMGTFTSARRYVMHTFANSQSAMMKKRVSAYMLSSACPSCHGKRLRPEALRVKFAGYDIADISALSLKRLKSTVAPYSQEASLRSKSAERALVTRRIVSEILARLQVLLDLGLGHLSLERSTPTLSPGELQRLRLATQLHSNLFGVVYVLDEPSAGLHPSDTESLMRALEALKRVGNSLFVVEHEIEVIKHADWLVDVGPAAGQNGGQILYSGPPSGLRDVSNSETARFLFRDRRSHSDKRRTPTGWLKLRNVQRNNLDGVDVDLPLGVLASVTGVSGSGKSTLISQALTDLISARLGRTSQANEDLDGLENDPVIGTSGEIAGGLQGIRRLVVVDQKPIGRTPRSNMATYTGLFDHVRTLFAQTKIAKGRKYDAGRFSFNVAKGRCETCKGEGFVCVELLFLPSVYSPCPTCKGSRFNARTLEVTYRDKNIADVLRMTVDEALVFFASDEPVKHTLNVLRDVGLSYLLLGQSATELSGGEAQRIKLATELQRLGHADTLYILDEPTTGLHPSDVCGLLAQFQTLVENGNTVIVVEHDMDVITASDWIIDVGPGAGDEGGKVIACGSPEEVAQSNKGRTAAYLAANLGLKSTV
jgi:excinuclease ABC subunit A